jgi:hypothetical protein
MYEFYIAELIVILFYKLIVRYSVGIENKGGGGWYAIF